jgi:hypothetical protein
MDVCTSLAEKRGLRRGGDGGCAPCSHNLFIWLWASFPEAVCMDVERVWESGWNRTAIVSLLLLLQGYYITDLITIDAVQCGHPDTQWTGKDGF